MCATHNKMKRQTKTGVIVQARYHKTYYMYVWTYVATILASQVDRSYIAYYVNIYKFILTITNFKKNSDSLFCF